MQQVKDQMMLKKMGARIRCFRKEQKLSQLDLAVMINNHAEQLGRIERGEINVTVGTLQKVADGLNITLGDIFPKE